MQGDAMQCNAMQCNAMQRNAMQRNAMRLPAHRPRPRVCAAAAVHVLTQEAVEGLAVCSYRKENAVGPRVCAFSLSVDTRVMSAQ